MSSTSPNRRVRDAVTKRAPRIVLYFRVSSKRQTDTDADIDPDGNSIDTQRKVCQAKVRELGGVVIDEYVEPAKSGQTLEKRPVFQEMMRRIHEDKDVDAVVIYLRSRAFRNYVDAGNTEVALAKLNVKLISASPKEEFGEGNMAQAMKAIMDVFNWLQVKQSGDDIKIKMANKARNGGTIGRAPVGYLNVTAALDGHKVNTVISDPDRKHYIPMAFELWASGQYLNIESLQAELTRAGLRMPRTGKPISAQTLYSLLRDRYYLGYVEYDGIEYQGRHTPLITDVELFDRAQRIFDVHGGTGTRQRTHNHYLKGLVWCGRCGYRLIVQRAVGRHGGEYFYFYCRGRQEGLCDLPSIPVEVMEAAVLTHYGEVLVMPSGWLAGLRARVDEAVDTNHAMTDTLRQEYAKQLETLERKENYFLDLAAEEGWPKDKLRDKIDGIRELRADIQDTLARSEQQLSRGRDVFLAALALLDRPQEAYAHGNETVRAILNRAFFTKLYVDGGKVINHDAQEPFGELNQVYRLDVARRNKATSRQPQAPAPTLKSQEGSPHLITADQGWSKPSMVDLVSAYSNRLDLATSLVKTLEQLQRAQLRSAPTSPDSVSSTGRSVRQWQVSDRLSDADMRLLVTAFEEGGTPKWKLAEQYGISESSVKRIIRKHRLNQAQQLSDS